MTGQKVNLTPDSLAQLMAMYPPPPMPSDDEIKRIHERHAGDIHQSSYCSKCQQYNYGHRLGCWNRDCENSSKLGSVEWIFQARNGAVGTACFIRHGEDFLFIYDRPAGTDKDRN